MPVHTVCSVLNHYSTYSHSGIIERMQSNSSVSFLFLTTHFIVDVNFDEYDKSDDPHDYKFVRWLTKEKVFMTDKRSISIILL